MCTEAGLAASSVGRYEAGLSTLRVDSFAAILTVLNKRGIRFVVESGDVEMGVILVKTGAPGDTLQPTTTAKGGRAGRSRAQVPGER